MQIYKFTPSKYFGSNTYILASGKEAAVIDPSVSFREAEKLLTDNGLTLKYIIITHAHFDHMLFIDEWVADTSAEVVVGKQDAKALSDSYYNCYSLFFGENKGYFGKYRIVLDGDVLKLSDTELCFIHTPGHTMGSVTIITDEALFVGDLCFPDGSVGRTDLPGGSYAELCNSVKRVEKLSENRKIYSGH